MILYMLNLNKRRCECPQSREICCCPKKKWSRDAHSVYRSDRKISCRSLVQRSWKRRAWRGFLKEFSNSQGWCSSKWCSEDKGKKKIQETITVLEVCTKLSKSYIMASSILSAYTYVEFIPWYVWLSLKSLFWSLVWIFMLWRVAKLFCLSMIKSRNILFWLYMLLWMNSYGRYFAIALWKKMTDVYIALRSQSSRWVGHHCYLGFCVFRFA
jgi:hypothetical protein